MPTGMSELYAAAKVYAPVPPEGLKVCEYGLPSVPLGSVPPAGEMPRGLTIIDRNQATALWPFASVASTEKLYEPGVVGVPVSAPETRDKPGGRAPVASVKVIGVAPVPGCTR